MHQGWGRHVQALQSPEQEGGVGKELRATPARWLHSSPWRKWGLRAVIWYTRTAFPVGLQGHFESKDYSLLMCERIFFFFCFFRLCEEIIRLIFISVAKGTWGEFKCTLCIGRSPSQTQVLPVECSPRHLPLLHPAVTRKPLSSSSGNRLIFLQLNRS